MTQNYKNQCKYMKQDKINHLNQYKLQIIVSKCRIKRSKKCHFGHENVECLH